MRDMQREYKWDNLKGFLILLVVIGHFTESFLADSHLYKSLWLCIYSFHMPLFFLVAGYFHRNQNIGRKLYFYISLSLLTGILIFVCAKLAGRNPSLKYLEVSSLPWFMLSMASFVGLAYLARYIDAFFVLGIAFVVGFFSGYDGQIGDMLALSRTLVFFPFYMVGICLRMNSEPFALTSKKPLLKAISLALVIGWAALCFLKIDRVYLLRPFFTGRNPFSASGIQVEGAFVRMGCYALTLVISFALMILTPEKRIPLLNRMGRKSLQIYVLHIPIRNAVEKLMQVDYFLNHPQHSSINRLLYLAAACLLALILSADLFSAPFDWLKKKILKEQQEDVPKLLSERREKYGSFSIRKDEWLPALAVAVFFVFTFLFYGPLGLYLQNAEELFFSLKTTLLIVIPVSLFAIALILLLVWILPRRAASFVIRLIFGITLGMYIQGTLININYGGVLDGTSINWGDYSLYGIATLILWLACIFAPFLLSGKKKIPLRTIMVAVALFLTAIQIPALIVERLSYNPSSHTNLLVSTEGEFEFSKQDNVIILALDTMDEAYYQEYLEAHPEFEEELTGFVHYDNAVASGSRTIIGMPSMLTGVPYTRESTFTEYIDTIWKEENPLSALHKKGYDVRVYTDKSFFSADTIEYVDNFINTSEEVDYRTLAKKLYKLTAYKFFPHYMKQLFWMDTAEFGEAESDENRYKTNDGIFYQDYLAKGLSLNDQIDHSFHYYLLNGAHSPYKLTENAEYVSKTTSRQQQVEGVFKIVREMLAEMKEKGIYDSATIILTTDHGNLHVEEHSSFLYKAPHDVEPYRTSHAPVSAFDIPVLLYDIIGEEMPNNLYGLDFRTLDEDAERERHFFRNTSGSSKIKIEEYVTRSEVQDKEAFLLISTFEDQRGPETPYTFGERLTFDMNATGNIYAVEGFGQNTGYRTLLVGPKAELQITLAEVPQTGTINIHFDIHSTIDSAKETIIRVNGIQVLDDVIDKQYVSSGITLFLPVEDLGLDQDNRLVITFEFPDIPMDEMEKPTPSRTRSFSLTAMEITHVD